MFIIPIIKIKEFKDVDFFNDFYINSFSYHLKENRKKIISSHRHNFYACILFTKGEGKHNIDIETYTVQPGSIFFLKPGQTHDLHMNTAEGYALFHSQDFFETSFLNEKLEKFPFYAFDRNSPHLVVTKKQMLSLEPYFKVLQTEVRKNDLYKKSKIASLLNVIYINISRFYMNSEKKNIVTSNHIKILQRFEHFLEKDYREEKLPSYYAEKLGISTKHLNRIVKASIGKTSTEFIKDRVVFKAKQSIINSSATLVIISSSLGFSDYAYFSNFFKRETGKFPKEYRKDHLKNNSKY